MAKNTGSRYRKGAVTNRTQFQAANGNYVKRDASTGRFLDQKTSGGAFKGIRKEN